VNVHYISVRRRHEIPFDFANNNLTLEDEDGDDDDDEGAMSTISFSISCMLNAALDSTLSRVTSLAFEEVPGMTVRIILVFKDDDDGDDDDE